jgi:hypothetical protein
VGNTSPCSLQTKYFRVITVKIKIQFETELVKFPRLLLVSFILVTTAIAFGISAKEFNIPLLNYIAHPLIWIGAAVNIIGIFISDH